MSEPLLVLDQVSKYYMTGEHRLRALKNIDLVIRQGEIIGLAGESGCGKSTLARLIAFLEKPSEGLITWMSPPFNRLDSQLIFQNPFTALNPRMRIGDAILEGVDLNRKLHPEDRVKRLQKLLEMVDLPFEFANRYSHELSGGQCQRVTIARALAVSPQLLIADEPLAALDLSAQLQLIDLLKRLYADSQSSLVLISHDLLLLKQLCHRVVILYLGEIVEIAAPEKLFTAPQHPYTQALIAAIPKPDPTFYRDKPTLSVLSSEIPSPLFPPSGCAFHPRCPKAKEICARHPPCWIEKDSNQAVRCHFATAP